MRRGWPRWARPELEVDEMGRLLAVVLLGGAVAFLLVNLADVKRYFKIRSM